MTMTLAELRSFALAMGFADPSTAAAIAFAESKGDPCALGDPPAPSSCSVPPSGPSTSFGLWQIHVPAHPQYDPARLLEPVYNAQAALAISGGGRSWGAWSTYNDRTYAQYLPGGSTAAHASVGILAIVAGVLLARRRRTSPLL
jgi:Lysozyme like domain